MTSVPATTILRPDDDTGGFRVGHDLRVLDVQAAPQSLLFRSCPPPGCIGQSVWNIFHGEARRAFYAVIKRLTTQEEPIPSASKTALTWEAHIGNGILYRFETVREASGFATRFGPLLQVPTVPTPKTPLHDTPVVNAGQEVNALVSHSLPFHPLAGSFFEQSSDPIALLKADGATVHANLAYYKAFDPARLARTTSGESTFVPVPLLETVHEKEREAFLHWIKTMASQLQEGVTPKGDIERFVSSCHDGKGGVRWFEWVATIANQTPTSLPLVRLFVTGRDITHSRLALEALQSEALRDPLTGLPNRRLLFDRLAGALASAPRRKAVVAVLVLDLDRFKRVNDTLGHQAGDDTLIQVGQRLQSALRDEDTVARLGGDEFVIVLPAVHDENDARRVARKITQALDGGLYVAGRPVRLGASVGVAISDGSDTPESMIARADGDMYRAKKQGICWISQSQNTETEREQVFEAMELEVRLGSALERRELHLHYQPQVRLHGTSNRVVGVEALMRWKPRGGEAISPVRFIPVAEETGLIRPIGEWAMREACRQAHEWELAGIGLRVAVNVSATQITDKRFPERVAACLREWGVSGKQLEVELTESTFVREEQAALDTLKRLRAMGIGLFVDDFGTGYANLSYLRRFPLDGVKVDRSFVRHIDTNPADAAVVRAVVDLSATLGLKVIAEGVETPAQRDVLRSLGCDMMQGFLFGMPTPPREVAGMLG